MKLGPIVAGLLGLIVASSAAAKCASKRFTIDVQVTDHCTGAPISGAAVILFANDDASASASRDAEGAPVNLSTGSDGFAHAEFWFDLTSGSGFFGDRCAGRLRKLEVVVMASGYDTQRLRINASEAGGRSRKSLLRSASLTLLPSAGNGSCYVHQSDFIIRDWSPNHSLQRTAAELNCR